jgi:hypothetical protein
MKKLSAYLTKFTAGTTDFPDGKIKDSSGPGIGDGSEGVAQSGNDWYYAIVAKIKKYIGDLSGTDESVTASDDLDALETAIGIKNPNVSEWASGTVYSIDDIVMYLGLQFVAMVASTGSIPLDNPDKWLPCFERNEAVINWKRGRAIEGGMDTLDNFRDAGYRQNFAWGKYNVGGFSGAGGAGRDYEAFGVHLDGTQITGNATLEAIFDVGGGNEYHLLDVVAPDVVGVRTLLDARGAAAAVVDAIAGDRANVGVFQDDAAQRVTGSFEARLHKSNLGPLLDQHTGVFSRGPGTQLLIYPDSTSSTTTFDDTDFDNADSTSPNPSKTDDAETRMKNYSVGVPTILVLNEI